MVYMFQLATYITYFLGLLRAKGYEIEPAVSH